MLGQVETVWNGLRVFCVVMGLISHSITPTLGAAVVMLLSGALVNMHLEVLPFHCTRENVVRGGIYTAVCWTAFARSVGLLKRHGLRARGVSGHEGGLPQPRGPSSEAILPGPSRGESARRGGSERPRHSATRWSVRAKVTKFPTPSSSPTPLPCGAHTAPPDSPRPPPSQSGLAVIE